MPSPSDVSSTATNLVGEIPVINGTQPQTTKTYYKSKDINGITTLRCPEGYVFQGSNTIFKNSSEDRGVVKYKDSDWLDLDGNPSNNQWKDDTFICKRQYCPPLGLVNSDREYQNPLVDNDTNKPQRVLCNEGYVFDTDSSRMGNVKCGVMPIMKESDLDNENEVTWMVSHPPSDKLCGAKKTEYDCTNTKIHYSISPNTQEIYDDKDGRFMCSWSPALDGKGINGLAKEGKCKFIHRADINNGEPICRSMYCSKKSVPNSNKVVGMSGPLPGPEEGSIHGDCINFDGQIISNITNSSDCACFKHKSCDKCTEEPSDCQWCGYDTKGVGGFCYSKKTHLDICSSESIHNDRGGTCTHVKTDKSKTNMPNKGWNKDSCEGNVCVKESVWNSLTPGTIIKPDIYIKANTESECTSNNNVWNSSALHTIKDHCILKNNKLNTKNLISNPPKYYPIFKNNNDIKLNIADKICMPDNTVPKKISPEKLLEMCTKMSNNNEASCTSIKGCKWGDNPLRDSLFNWVTDKKIIFNGGNNGKNCPIHKRGSKNNKNKLEFEINKENNGYITLKNSTLNTGALSVNSITDNIQYKKNSNDPACNIINTNLYKNISSLRRTVGTNTVCQTKFLGRYYSIPQTCEAPGIKYCDNKTKTNDGSQACPNNSKISVTINNKTRTIDGCYYHIDKTKAENGNKCYGSNVKYKCYPPNNIPEPYDCDKDLSPGNNKDNQSVCTNTNYISGDYKRVNDITINKTPFKNYITCSTQKSGIETLNKDRCNYIGQDKGHYGNYCVAKFGNKNTNIPIKQVCELVTPLDGATWGKYHDKDTFDWGCYRKDGTKYKDDEICGLVGVPDGQGVSSSKELEETTINTKTSTNIIDIIIFNFKKNINIKRNKKVIQKGSSGEGIIIKNSTSKQLYIKVKAGTFKQTGTLMIKGSSTIGKPISFINYIPPAKSVILLNMDTSLLTKDVNENDIVTLTGTNVTGEVAININSPSNYLVIRNIKNGSFTGSGTISIKHNGSSISGKYIKKINVLSAIQENPACIIDYGSGDDSNILKNICEKSSITSDIKHDIGFTYNKKSTSTSNIGECQKPNNADTTEDIKKLPKNVCTESNYKYVTEYKYTNVGTCGSLNGGVGPELRNQPDIPTTWTGGEISTGEDGLHTSECSPSIMSSCNANCNPGYGGGGEYICQYNSSGGDVCKLIDAKDVELTNSLLTKKELCESYPACKFDSSTKKCSHNKDVPNDGHLEWIGSPCYKLDNTAFSHGIAMLPELDKVIPPFVRVLMYMGGVLIISFAGLALLTHLLLKYIGKGIDLSINKTLDGTNKIIDIFTDADKLIRIIMAPQPKPEEKVGICIAVISIFIGTYYLFKHIRDYIKHAFSTGGGIIFTLQRKLKSIPLPTIPYGTPIGSALIDNAENAGNKIADGVTDTKNIMTDTLSSVPEDISKRASKIKDASNLNIIIQASVGGIVVLIIVLFVVKSDLIGKRIG